MKRTLYVFARVHDAKPSFLYTVVIEPAKNVLGASDIIALAYADLMDHDADSLLVVREEYALRRGWIAKRAIVAPPPFVSTRRPQTAPSKSARADNPFDE